MTFPRPADRPVYSPSLHPSPITHPPPARAWPKGGGAGGEPVPPGGWLILPGPFQSAGGKGGARRSPGGAGLRGLDLTF